jgi:[protein-PII] uridylyltransferase
MADMQQEVGRLRRRFRQGRAELFPQDARTAPCRELLENYTQLIDSLVEDIYSVSCRSADLAAPRSERAALAIVATGGYGRKELNPFSDIDIAFIPSEEQDPWVEAAVHMAFKLVMDVFLSFREIRVGYSYRPLPEVSTWDLRTRTALLDARRLCGDESLTAELGKQLRKSMSPLDLVLELQIERERRRNSELATLYSVEPNLKEGSGSLRDLHRARWIFKLLLGVDDPQLLPALRERRYLSRVEIAAVESAQEWFWRVRNWLHLTAGKKSDVLITNFQDRIARELDDRAAQDWLAEHYRHAERLASFREAAIRATLEGPVELDGVLLIDGALQRCVDQNGPGSAVRLLRLSQHYSLPVSFRELKCLEQNWQGASEAIEREESWAFLGILNQEGQIASTLRLLIRFGLIDRFVDGFSRIMRYVPPDPAHRFTVGEHSLRMIEHLEELRLGRDRRLERFTELASQCEHFDMLCLAALLHDSGKLLPGDHSEAGLALVERVGRRLELAPEKLELLRVLVRRHLLLVRTSRLQDLKSSAVIQNVADSVLTVDALRHLYLFTYVDTCAVAEKSWTSMDYRDLEELYRKVQNHLTGQQEIAKSIAVEDKLGQIRRRLGSKAHFDEQAVLRHCDAMPAGYVLNTPLDEIAAHMQLLERLESERVVLDVYNRAGDDYSELTVCTYDDPRPGMLAKIAGVLYGCNADIHKAQVFTMEKERPVVLDTLWIRAGALQISENRAARIRTALKEVLTGARTVGDFLKSAGKNTPGPIPIESMDLRNDLSEEHTVVHILARDSQGLLYQMTRALSRSGLYIHSAKVATWAACAENNFYVTTLTGTQIPAADLPHWKEQLERILRGQGKD